MISPKAVTLVVTALGSVFLSPALHAQEFQPEEVVESVNIADMRQLAEQAGHTVFKEDTDGKVLLLARTPSGGVYSLQGTSCDREGVPGCRGLGLTTIFTPTEQVTVQNVVAANYFGGLVSVWMDTGRENLIISRYLIFDHGVTRMNIVSNIQTFIGLVPKALAQAKGEAE